jgi:hypothetical protein
MIMTRTLSMAEFPIDREAVPAIVYVRFRNILKRYRTIMSADLSKADLAFIAWMARNILELSVWIQYCSRSRSKAEEFYDDAIRDLVDLNRINPNPTEPGWKDLAQIAKSLPAIRKPHQYKKGSVAESVGRICEVG